MTDAHEPDRDRCPSCRVLWTQHNGIQGTCAELLEATKEIERLKDFERYTWYLLWCFGRREKALPMCSMKKAAWVDSHPDFIRWKKECAPK